MKKIAVVFEGNINRRYGVFNAVVNRVKYLRKVSGYDVDIFMIQVYDKWLTRKLRHSEPQRHQPATIEEDGETIKMWWISRSLIDSLSHHLLHKAPAHLLKKFDRLAAQLEGYDIVSAHDLFPAYLAWSASRKLQIPFFVTWAWAPAYTPLLWSTR